NSGGFPIAVPARFAGASQDRQPTSTARARSHAPAGEQSSVARAEVPSSVSPQLLGACVQQMAHGQKANTKRSRLTNRCQTAYRFSSAPKERTARDWRMLEFQ